MAPSSKSWYAAPWEWSASAPHVVRGTGADGSGVERWLQAGAEAAVAAGTGVLWLQSGSDGAEAARWAQRLVNLHAESRWRHFEAGWERNVPDHAHRLCLEDCSGFEHNAFESAESLFRGGRGYVPLDHLVDGEHAVVIQGATRRVQGALVRLIRRRARFAQNPLLVLIDEPQLPTDEPSVPWDLWEHAARREPTWVWRRIGTHPLEPSKNQGVVCLNAERRFSPQQSPCWALDWKDGAKIVRPPETLFLPEPKHPTWKDAVPVQPSREQWVEEQMNAALPRGELRARPRL